VFVSQASAASLKDKVTTITTNPAFSNGATSSSSSNSNSNSNSEISSNTAFADPFNKDTLDKRLFVTDIEPEHSIVLNRFNTVEGHVSTVFLFIIRVLQCPSLIYNVGDTTESCYTESLVVYCSFPLYSHTHIHKYSSLY
jgi:Ap4A phosphorylase N-terminal domain